MTDGIEEEKLADDEGSDKHDGGGDHHGCQAGDVHGSNDVEDDVAGALDGFLDAHFWDDEVEIFS